MAVLRHKESIHSGQFMVSNLEPEDNTGCDTDLDVGGEVFTRDQARFQSVFGPDKRIDDSLAKLFTCMSKVYAHKLSSPKWNRFLGLKLRWKDKIRLNNLIWRCWHMQYISGRKQQLMFDLVNPLEAGGVAAEGGGTLMMGQYWTRRLEAVLAEYKSWRVYYCSSGPGTGPRTSPPAKKTNHVVADDIDLASMVTDADLFINAFMADLASTSPLELEEDWAALTNADFIQAGLISVHRPGLEDTPGLGLAASRDSLDTEAAAAVAPHLVCSDTRPAPAPARSSELASILQRGPGQYILEKRQETEIRSSVCELEEAFRSPSSIKQSVIVQPPTSSSTCPTSCLDSASTSHQSPAARQPRKRKLPPQNVASAESQNSQNPQNSQNSQNSTAGFSQLAALVPGLAEGGSIKVSKAAQLMKAADHIRGLKTENQNLEEEIELLQASNQDLLDNILSFQTQLANNGKSCPGPPSSGTLEDLFSLHVRASSLHNWKYWVFAQVLQPLVTSYEKSVGSTSHHTLARAACSWLDQHANLVTLRPLVTQMLKKFSVESTILTDPKRLPLEALEKTSINKKLDIDKHII